MPINVMTVHRFLSPIAIAAALLILSVDVAAHETSTKSSTKGHDKAMLIQKDYDALTGRWQLVKSIIDANNKRACWGKPGGTRPTDFTSKPGSGRTLQYWRLISKELGK